MRGEIDEFVHSLEAAQTTRQRGVSLNTILAYRSDLEQFLAFLQRQGATSWEISSLEIINYKRDLETRYAKATTRARKIAAVKALYRYLVTAGRVAHDPARNLDLPIPIKRAPETLGRDQLQQLVESARATPDMPLLDQIKAVRDYAMLSLLCTTGLLASELVAMDLDDLTADGRVELGAPARRRVVNLDVDTDAAVQRYLAEARPVLAKGLTDEPALFVNHRGSRLTRQGFWLIIKQCATRAGIDGISPRLLRHSCAAQKLTAGVQLKQVQELLGHAHASTTQAYVRARPLEALT